MAHIKTFARLKPTSSEHHIEYSINGGQLQVQVPEQYRDFTASPGKLRPHISYDFQFDQIFDTDATQENVFESIRDIVDGFLAGYNGTVFAYGQTGTGKTYTVEGSARRYAERGIAPRALSMVYKALADREEEEITVHISYLEIYQEVAYDLLASDLHHFTPVPLFPKVTVVEGPGGSCVVRNLSLHLAAQEAVAQALLLQGQASRHVAETPVNQRSSRSHAVFTLHLAARSPNQPTIIRSKLHLVDLAGSERVAKSGVGGQQLTEAKCINLSLHYLESVIIALQADPALNSTRNHRQQRSASANRSFNSSAALLPTTPRPASAESVKGPRHVPYRNSLLTMVLRDSLGGNCQTAMIATISLELINVGETLSTCRFAQRVACIANYARRNEEIDDKTLIKRLKKKVADLESEISCLKMSITEGGEQSLEEVGRGLSEEDRTLCSQIIRDYLSGRLTDPVLAGIQSPYRFRECLRILKKMVFKNYFQPDSQPPQHQRAVTSGHSGSRPRGRRQDRGRSLQEGGEAGERTAVFTSPRPDVQVLQFTDNTGDSNSGGPRPATVEAWTEGKDGATTHSQPAAPLQVSGSSSHHRDAVSNGNHDAAEAGMNRPSRETSAGLSEADWDQILGEKSHGTKSHSPGKPPAPGSWESRPQGSPTGPRRRYKSPFERKREKEIGKLSRQLEEMVGDVETKESSLQQLQSAIRQEEMDAKENTLRVHLQVTEEKVADQRAYIRQLQDTEADPALLDQEKLVERQLSKKKARLKMRLTELLEERGKAADGSSHTSEDKLDPRRVIEEKISVYKKRDGTLNTRQVFEMLQKEQKKQKKHQDRVEREEILTKSRQLELREEATRQRLRDLKEMLRLSQAAAPPPPCLPQGEQPARPSSQPAPSARSHALSHASFSSMEAGGAFPAGDQTDTRDSGAWQPPKAKSSARAAQNGHGREEERTGASQSQDGAMTGVAGDAHPRPGSSKSAWSLGSAVPDSNFYLSRRSSQTPSDKWDSAYSTRPQTAQTSVSQGRGQSGSSPVGSQPSSGLRVTPEHSALVAPSSAGPASVGAVATSPVEELSGWGSGAQNQRENSNAFTAGSLSSQSVNYYGQALSHSVSPQRGSGFPQDSGLKFSSEDSKVKNGEVKPEKPSSSSASASASKTVQGPREPSPEKIMPSEYVYRMGVKENFDARRMGLSSQTFDAALSTMLDGLGDDYYDQYARQGGSHDRQGNRGKNKGGREQQRRTQKKKERKVETEEPEEVDEVSKLKKVWGAESKYSSVAARLANFLDSASEGEEEGPRLAHKPPVPSSDRQSRSRNRARQSTSTAAGSFDAKLAEFQDFDTDLGPPKVTALRETEREVAYMSKASAERHRIAKIRQARRAAEVIQRHWRKYRARR